MGLADDAYNTRPFLKFFVQVLCGVILIFSSVNKPSDHSTIIQIFENNTLNYILTIVWVVGIMNSINMLDNMDGITSLTSIFIILIILFYLSINSDFENFDFIALLGFSCTHAFLFYNWHPSKMFMGDLEVNLLDYSLCFCIKYIEFIFLW